MQSGAMGLHAAPKKILCNRTLKTQLQASGDTIPAPLELLHAMCPIM